jgi:hypothetical protein
MIDDSLIKMFPHITEDYMYFIKRYLVTHCYSEYCRKIYSYPEEEVGYMTNLIKYKDDETVWNEIFQKQHIILKYYMKLLEHYPENEGKLKQASVYLQETFQEFVDRQVNIKTIGPYDYQQFIRSMQDEGFRQKIFEKYEISDNERRVKNNIIYIVQLYLNEKTNTSYYFTDEERNEMDLSLDILPYLQYIAKNGWLYQDIKDEKIEKETIEERNELNVLKTIGELLF